MKQKHVNTWFKMAMQEVAMQTDLTEAINVVIVKPQVKFSYTLYGTDAK